MGRRGAGGRDSSAHGASGGSRGEQDPRREPYREPQREPYRDPQHEPYREPQREQRGEPYREPQREPFGNPQRELYPDPQRELYRDPPREAYRDPQREQLREPQVPGGMRQREPGARPPESFQSFQPAPAPAQPPVSRPPGERPPNQPPASRSRQQAKKKPGHGATYSVVVMTLAALAGVGVLAAQAAATAPKVSNAAKGKGSTQPGPAGTSTSAATSPNPLPAGSGSGLRVVYGEAAKRVWLVSAQNAVVRTMAVVPGTVPAPSGTYTVTSKLPSETGTDGTPVQYVVVYGKIRVSGKSVALGFDAVANVTGLPPAPTSRTGAVRMTQADAQALFNFSSDGTEIVVMP
jgi:hypothetical protein